MIRPPGLLATAICAISAPAHGQAPCSLAAPAETVRVERAVDGDTALLADGREVRLAAVAAPKTPLGMKPEAWPLAAGARAALAAALSGRTVELRLSGRTPDRYGRLRGFLSEPGAADHTGVAADLTARGLLRWTADNSDCAATLRAAEDRARAARLGLWAEPYYEVRDAADGEALMKAEGRFVVAEGRVASVRTAAGRLYVNFGKRWRNALSLTVSEATLRRLGGVHALDLRTGARVRARGVVEARRGPIIEVLNREQIERLDGAPGR
ncbi:thermonuclease family protein [Hansschlegelia beijingensis]|uniref:Endonuclease YncB(Thermonuclease family) n=1 Tax=Hansschlegelia beijingensis TaxID=1133344 RepID=A0A7W6GGW2_9HYPH|nr:endonuclease YncB(thermonuclease family) [Hansschlegelia beijingensis]